MVRGRRPMVDDRSLVNGILYVVTTGCRWRDMSSRYGSYVTAWRMLRRLQEMGVWDRILRFLASLRYTLLRQRIQKD